MKKQRVLDLNVAVEIKENGAYVYKDENYFVDSNILTSLKKKDRETLEEHKIAEKKDIHLIKFVDMPLANLLLTSKDFVEVKKELEKI